MSLCAMSVSFNNLSKNSSYAIKGFAIFLIVFHNFLHWTSPLNGLGENELGLNPNRIFHLISLIYNDPLIFLNALFTYFGHYGVQLFVFMSGYGLAKKYQNMAQIKYKNYIISTSLKLYSLVIFGIICYIVIFFKEIQITSFLLWIVSVLLMFNNLFYNRIFMNVGPWWYYSLALQLYFVFPLLRKYIFRGDEKTFFIILLGSYLIIYILFPLLEPLKIPLYGNFIGHLPEFLLGIGLVRFSLWEFNSKIITLSILIFILSNLFQSIFPFSFLSMAIILLTISFYILKLPILVNVFSYLGKISMFIFIINGPLRGLTMKYLVFSDSYIKTLMGAGVHFIIVVLCSIFMSYIYGLLFQPFISKIRSNLT